MNIRKELTIKELFIEMKTLYARLIILAEKYNRSLLTVSAIKWEDIVVQGGKKGDIMLNKEIKKDIIKTEFDIVKESYESYKEEALEKIRDMIANKSVGYCIAYFRDELHWKWQDICKVFNYSRIQANRIYKKFKNNSNGTI